VVPLFAYPITEAELGIIQVHPGFKQFVCVPSSPTFVPLKEIALLALSCAHNGLRFIHFESQYSESISKAVLQK